MTSKSKKSTRRMSSSRQTASRSGRQAPGRDSEGRFVSEQENYRPDMQGRSYSYNDDYYDDRQPHYQSRGENWRGAQNDGWYDEGRYQSRGYEPYGGNNDYEDEDDYSASNRDIEDAGRYASRRSTGGYEHGWQGASEGYDRSYPMRGNRGASMRDEGSYGNDDRDYYDNRSYGMQERSGRHGGGEYRGMSRPRGGMSERGHFEDDRSRGSSRGWRGQSRGRQDYDNY